MISLKKYDPCHDLGSSPDREEFRSCVLLPMYLAVIYDRDMAVALNNGLRRNLPSAFAQLLFAERHYDNSTGRMAERS